MRHISSYKVPLIRRGITAILPYNMREFIPIVTVWLRRRARTKSASHAAEKARASAKKTTTEAKKKAPSSTSTPKARSASTTRSSSTKKRAAPKKRNTSSRKPSPVVLPELGVGERYFVLDIPFEMESLASYYKAKYYKGYGHVFTGKQLPPPLKHFKSQDYTYERWVEDDLNGSVAPITMTKSKFVPRPHQQEALKKIFASAKHGYRGFIEADDVGLERLSPVLTEPMERLRSERARTYSSSALSLLSPTGQTLSKASHKRMDSVTVFLTMKAVKSS